MVIIILMIIVGVLTEKFIKAPCQPTTNNFIYGNNWFDFFLEGLAQLVWGRCY